MMTFLYVLAVAALGVGLVIFSYLDRIYRELGRVNKGRIREHLEFFEAEIEPHFGLERARATTAFRLLANLWLVLVTAETARGVIVFVPGTWDALVQALVYVLVEVLLLLPIHSGIFAGAHFRTMADSPGLIIRAFLWLVWPFRVVLELAISLAHISDDPQADGSPLEEEGIGALVDAAEQEGILNPGEAQMIEQVVEFSDKRVLEFMTPRPEVIAIPASATVAQLRKLLIETKFSRIPVYEDTLDDVTGIAFARDLLQIPESEAATRTVRELARPAFFVPETKHGSDLLKEMQRRNQQMAIVVDEYGSVGGIVTVEDLVEEIIGEIGEDDRVPAPDAVRESGRQPDPARQRLRRKSAGTVRRGMGRQRRGIGDDDRRLAESHRRARAGCGRTSRLRRPAL
jgi:putative hemolysin